eukprot:PLAT6018.1.p1 GENE.PLAT6018.1~~PLAT6018.1.p1  ORF type:complete len:693 (-),score=319.84 PLAT6018.1:81-2159(-)
MPSRKTLVGGVAALALATAFWQLRSRSKTRPSRPVAAAGEVKKSGRRRVRVDGAFVERLKRLLRILFPSWGCASMKLLLLHSGFLFARTLVSIVVAKLDGSIVRALVEREGRTFATLIAKWLALAVPASYINSMIKYLESKLSARFRTTLTSHALQRYMQNDTYYRVSAIDSRLTNADQCLTQDIAKFCSTLAHLWGQLSKPMLDVVLITYSLFSTAAERGASGVMPSIIGASAIFITAKVLRAVSPPFGRLVKEEAELEGKYRFVHSRLIYNAEEIAFYQGHAIEEGILQRYYSQLVKHMHLIYRKRIGYNMLESFFLKYFWSTCGLLIVAYPSFSGAITVKETASSRTQDFVTARGLLIQCADAVERVMTSYKEITELAGYAYRVSDMLDVFSDVAKGHYEKPLVMADARKRAILSGRGELVDGALDVKFDHVPIVTPTGDVLVKEMSFHVQPGMHLLISGPNGCGKSSLFRILGGLWPVYAGRMAKPARGDVFYIPQKPYLSLGTLREQVTYPHTLAQVRDAGYDDEDLEEILNRVHLSYIVEREGGWDAIASWQDVLSGGEKQRMAMARLFYHHPRYAILDECTSAVSMDVEGEMYTYAKDLKITLLTVTHRPSLWKYHDYVLQFDGAGGWRFEELSLDSRMGLKEEKSQLENELSSIAGKRERLAELCSLLGEESSLLDEEADTEAE